MFFESVGGSNFARSRTYWVRCPRGFGGGVCRGVLGRRPGRGRCKGVSNGRKRSQDSSVEIHPVVENGRCERLLQRCSRREATKSSVRLRVRLKPFPTALCATPMGAGSCFAPVARWPRPRRPRTACEAEVRQRRSVLEARLGACKWRPRNERRGLNGGKTTWSGAPTRCTRGYRLTARTDHHHGARSLLSLEAGLSACHQLRSDLHCCGHAPCHDHREPACARASLRPPCARLRPRRYGENNRAASAP